MVCVSVVPLLVIVCAFILLLVGSHHHFELIEIHFSILVHVVSRNHLAGLILRQGDFTNLTKRRKRQSLLRSKVYWRFWTFFWTPAEKVWSKTFKTRQACFAVKIHFNYFNKKLLFCTWWKKFFNSSLVMNPSLSRSKVSKACIRFVSLRDSSSVNRNTCKNS